MNDLADEFDSKYHIRSRYDVELDEGDNVKCLIKNTELSSTKIQHKLIWTWIISMARTKDFKDLARTYDLDIDPWWLEKYQDSSCFSK